MLPETRGPRPASHRAHRLEPPSPVARQAARHPGDPEHSGSIHEQRGNTGFRESYCRPGVEGLKLRSIKTQQPTPRAYPQIPFRCLRQCRDIGVRQTVFHMPIAHIEFLCVTCQRGHHHQRQPNACPEPASRPAPMLLPLRFEAGRRHTRWRMLGWTPRDRKTPTQRLPTPGAFAVCGDARWNFL